MYLNLKDSYFERLQALNLTTLLYRREHYDLIQVFRIVNGFDINSETFSFNDNTARGHLFRITKPSVNKTLHFNTFLVRTNDSWNNLSEDIVSSDSVLSFNPGLAE